VGSLDFDEMILPSLKKMEFFVLFRTNVSEPVFLPNVTHWRSSAKSIVFRLPESDICPPSLYNMMRCQLFWAQSRLAL
jgi:hypothetical protein